MFKGYFERGGVELINSERTEAYIRHQLPGMAFKATVRSQNIHVALGDGAYESPLVDDAPWVNPSDPATHGFFGLYPLEIKGDGDSTLEASVIESTSNGGTVGEARDASRPLYVRGALLARDQLSAESGLSWLRQAVRSDDCGMHGQACGSSDVTFFLADPDVCWPKWDSAEPTITEDVPIGTITPETSPAVGNVYSGLEDVDYTTAPGRQSFSYVLGAESDGAVFEYGRVSASDSKVLQRKGPYVAQRTNYAANPSFTTGTNNWAVSANGALSRVAAGGVDGGAFGRLVEAVPISVRTNWFNDPAFTLDPAVSGWRTDGAIARVANGGIVPGVTTSAAAVTGASYAEVTLPGPGPITADGVAATASFYVDAATPQDYVVTVTDNVGEQRYTHTFTAAGDGRLDFTTPMSGGWVLRIAASADFALSGLLLETGAVLAAYFDGSFADVPLSNIDYLFLNGTVLSPSRRIEGVRLNFTLTQSGPTTPFGALTAALQLRSDSSATLTVDILSSADSSVLATAVFRPGTEWARYSVGTLYGGGIILRITSNGSFDIDQVLIEHGDDVDPYFDGSTPSLAGYTTVWLAGTNSSASRVTFDGDEPIDPLHPNNRTVSIDWTDSDFRPYMSVLDGRLDQVVLHYGIAALVPMEEQLEPYERTYHRIEATSGPRVLQSTQLSIGYLIEVEFTMTAGTPFAYSTAREVDTAGIASAIFSDILDVVTNLFPNPSGEVATTGFGVIPGTTGAAAITNPVSPTAFGTHVIRATWSTASTAAGGGLYIDAAVEAGEAYNVDVFHVKSSINQRLRLRTEWRTASATISPVNGAELAVLAGVVNPFEMDDIVAPPTAAVLRLHIESVAGTGYANWSIGSYLEVDALQATHGRAEYPYFDGSTADTADYIYNYTGTTGLSTSTRTVVPEIVDLLQDPDCDPLPVPPRPPVIDESCSISDDIDWLRYYIPIPAADVAMWANTVPTTRITSKTTEVRQLRARFYPNPFEYPLASVDPLSYCAEFILSYIPANTALEVNGVTEEAWASVAGRTSVPADHLLYGTDGTPMTWPELSCAVPYLMTLDVPIGTVIGDIDFELVVNRRE